ncbi:MAG TPA: UDP-3-O-acyl-N-acetylglucosamine deacetylase [Rickettsiales bacterium]|nr:UDP-3-O-acyl-N-acetylglucosamine deacetylase [Rickettsiales bacterium]
MKQKTIKNSVSFSGIGLHSGVEVNITINPAEAGTGIIFKRVDVKDQQNEIRALYSSVINTNLGTTIGVSNYFQKLLSKTLLRFGILREYGAVVRTIEHFMASLWACDIDNAIIEIDNKEIPILDGSTELFIKEIKKAGVRELDEDRKLLVVKKEVEVRNDFGAVRLLPCDEFKVDLAIDFNYGGIGRQVYSFDGNQKTFLEELSRARTFCNIKDIERMRKHGLARGGNYDNAMVFDNDKILNKDGFRMDCEPVKHKILDCVGDMFTSGYFMKCHIIANKTGHTLNNKVLKKLFSDKDNYDFIF